MEESSHYPVLLSGEVVAKAIGSPLRWRMLKALSAGEALQINELANAAGCSQNSASKHVSTLHEARVVKRGRGRLCSLDLQFVRNPAPGIIDFGVLRVDFNRTHFD